MAITDYDDVIDVRAVIERVEHLRQLRQPGPVDLGDEDNAAAQDDLFAELATLEALLADIKGREGNHKWEGDWYPTILIRDSYFRDYAEELAEDIGAVNPDFGWPYDCIDWERAARELQMDYSPVEFGNVTYWYR